MKFTTTKNGLIKGLSTVSRAISPKAMQAILGCVLIEVGDSIQLMGNNLEIGIQTAIEGDIEQIGSIAVEAKMFLEVIKKMPDGDVLIETEEETVHIKSGKAKFKIPFKDPEDYPRLPENEGGIHFTVDGGEFKDMIQKTAFAAAENSSNKPMEGVNLVIFNNSLSMTALDGHRIAERHLPINSKDVNVIVPAKTMKEISAIVTEVEMHIYVTDKYMTAMFGETLVISRLIGGKYFETDAIMKGNSSMTVKVDRKEFYNCIDRAALLTKDATKKPVIAHITDKIHISINAVMGKMDEDVDAVVDGEEIKIGFNPTFMMDALSAIEDRDVTLYLTNNKSPIVIKDNETYTYLVLPVNFAEG